MERWTEGMNQEIEDRAERIATELPIKVFIGGKQVDVDDQTLCGGEIHISLELPLFYSETGKLGYVKIEMPKKMAA